MSTTNMLPMWFRKMAEIQQYVQDVVRDPETPGDLRAFSNRTLELIPKTPLQQGSFRQFFQSHIANPGEVEINNVKRTFREFLDEIGRFPVTDMLHLEVKVCAEKEDPQLRLVSDITFGHMKLGAAFKSAEALDILDAILAAKVPDAFYTPGMLDAELTVNELVARVLNV